MEIGPRNEITQRRFIREWTREINGNLYTFIRSESTNQNGDHMVVITSFRDDNPMYNISWLNGKLYRFMNMRVDNVTP